jgi:hypothetical protein
VIAESVNERAVDRALDLGECAGDDRTGVGGVLRDGERIRSRAGDEGSRVAGDGAT